MDVLTKTRLTYDGYRFIMAQQNAIDTSKYIESEKHHKDLYFDDQGLPSQNFYIWWIDNHAENFRKAWYTSCCRKCTKVVQCKLCLKNECTLFVYDIEWANSMLKELL